MKKIFYSHIKIAEYRHLINTSTYMKLTSKTKKKNLGREKEESLLVKQRRRI